MDPNFITPQQAVASFTSQVFAKVSHVWPPNHLFAGIAPFLWPFVLLSLGVALTPASPLSWSYSTWLLFIIPLIITVFAPIRTFSGPLRFAYLEYASKIASLTVSLLKVAVVYFQSIPTLALPAIFILPVLPLLFFVFFPALPILWHFIAYHYRRRLNTVASSASTITARLDLVVAQARRADILAHKYEKQALEFVSTTQRSASQTLALHGANFFDKSPSVHKARQVISDEAEKVRELGSSLTDKMSSLDASVGDVESEAAKIRALLEQAVMIAVEGDVAKGEILTAGAADSLEAVIESVQQLCSTSDDVRQVWVELSMGLWTIP